ncbi:MAG: hypothetical protein V4546_12040 [Bacteroidota bacterium]
MKKSQIIILTIFSILILTSSINVKGQNYATLNYWGQDVKLDRDFFQILNNKRSGFIEEVKSLRYYDFKDYNILYVSLVDNLKSNSFTIIVTEANEIQWRNGSNMTGADETNKKKKTRASWLYYKLLLPSLQEFVKIKL